MVKKSAAPNTRVLEEHWLSSLIGSMTDGVIAIDHTGTIVLNNGAAQNILDSNETIAGKQLNKVCTPLDSSKKPVDLQNLIQLSFKPQTRRDLLLAYSDGSTANLYLSSAPVSHSYGQEGADGYVLLLRDITHEKSLEEERDEFISVVSHELRTPIAIAEGSVSNAKLMLGKEGAGQQIQNALDQTYDQIMFLGGLINDLSTLSRAERGTKQVKSEPVNAHQLLQDLKENYKSEARAKNLRLEVDKDEQLELLHSSPLYVREILQNFITNSIKYTEKGAITIAARPKQGGVEFSVSDTGIGISKSDQAKVFERFFRSGDYRTRASSGTGLGLYVTMKLARLIKAEITLSSRLNHGTTFRIFIPNL